MYIAILKTAYEVFAIGETEAEVKRRIVKGYKECYPAPERREFPRPTFKELHEWYGVCIYEIDPQKGYTHE